MTYVPKWMPSESAKALVALLAAGLIIIAVAAGLVAGFRYFLDAIHR